MVYSVFHAAVFRTPFDNGVTQHDVVRPKSTNRKNWTTLRHSGCHGRHRPRLFARRNSKAGEVRLKVQLRWRLGGLIGLGPCFCAWQWGDPLGSILRIFHTESVVVAVLG
jgi:hypothetical protein